MKRAPGAPARLALFLAIACFASPPAGAALAGSPSPSGKSPLAPDDVRLVASAAILAGEWSLALREVEKAIAADGDAGSAKGLSYLRGHILDGLGRPRDAADAFAQALAQGPRSLAPYARYRLALAQVRMRHPEVAAGLLATLLGSRPPGDLIEPAVRLLRTALAEGGDCRVTPLGLGQSFDKAERRRLAFARAACGERHGDRDTAAETYRQLLDQDLDDDVALDAAEAWASHDPNPPRHAAELLGLAFHRHREFAIAARYLEPLAAASASFDVRYATLRGEFWRGNYQAAAKGYAALLPTLPEQTRRALVAYQLARSLELAGDPAGAAAAYRQSYEADPKGEDASAALLSALRVDWRRGREKEALRILDQLRTRTAWRSAAQRGALFLASGEVAGGRANRAAAWLDVARLAGGSEDEIAYWQGRLAELSGGLPAAQAAVLAYGGAIRAAPWSPFAAAAGRRLREPALATAAKSEAGRLAATGSFQDLVTAWALLDRGRVNSPTPDPTPVARKLMAALAGDAVAQSFLSAAPIPVAGWPIWGIPEPTPQEELLGLASWGEGAKVLAQYFVATNPSLALTGAELAARGGQPRRGLALALDAIGRLPAAIPLPLVSKDLLRQVYPRPFRALVEHEAARHKVDPHLLTAILREESRFDPHAMSGAAARGLAQFVLPTAREVGQRLGFGALKPADLETPEIAIALAAAYLAELVERTGSPERAVAAYNAGEAQVALWKSTCVSAEPEEFLSKVSFKETRAYVQRVLTSRNAYAEIYR